MDWWLFICRHHEVVFVQYFGLQRKQPVKCIRDHEAFSGPVYVLMLCSCYIWICLPASTLSLGQNKIKHVSGSTGHTMCQIWARKLGFFGFMSSFYRNDRGSTTRSSPDSHWSMLLMLEIRAKHGCALEQLYRATVPPLFTCFSCCKLNPRIALS